MLAHEGQASRHTRPAGHHVSMHKPSQTTSIPWDVMSSIATHRIVIQSKNYRRQGVILAAPADIVDPHSPLVGTWVDTFKPLLAHTPRWRAYTDGSWYPSPSDNADPQPPRLPSPAPPVLPPRQPRRQSTKRPPPSPCTARGVTPPDTAPLHSLHSSVFLFE